LVAMEKETAGEGKRGSSMIESSLKEGDFERRGKVK